LGNVAIIMSILPGRHGSGKDAIFNGAIADIAGAIDVRDGLILVLGCPDPQPDWIYRQGVAWRVKELKAPSLWAAAAYLIASRVAGRKITLSQALFLSGGVVRQINRILAAEDCGLVIFDTIRTFDDPVAPRARRVVMFDDLFSERYREQARRGDRPPRGVMGRYAGASPLADRLLRPAWLGRWALALEARLCQAKETYVARRASACVLLNENEQARLSMRSGMPIHCYIPRLGSPHAAGPAAAGTGYWLFVGAMDYAPNAEAVSWLAEAIVPRYRRAGGTLPVRVIGRNCPDRLQDQITAAGIEYLGFVDDLAAAYDGALGVLMPVLGGSGVKIKCLEAFSFGCLTVGTPKAYEGLGTLPPAAISAVSADEFALAMLAAERPSEQTAAEGRSAQLGWFEAKFGPRRLERLRAIVQA
jgi:hypothetical protein